MAFEATTINGEIVDFSVRPLGLYDHPSALVQPLGRKSVIDAQMNFSYDEFEHLIKYFLSYGGSTNDPRFQTVGEIKSYLQLKEMGNEPDKWMFGRRKESTIVRKNSKENLQVRLKKEYVEFEFFDDEPYSLFSLNAFCDVLLTSFFFEAPPSWTVFIEFQRKIHLYLNERSIVRSTVNENELVLKPTKMASENQKLDY